MRIQRTKYVYYNMYDLQVYCERHIIINIFSKFYEKILNIDKVIN